MIIALSKYQLFFKGFTNYINLRTTFSRRRWREFFNTSKSIIHLGFGCPKNNKQMEYDVTEDNSSILLESLLPMIKPVMFNS